MVTKGPLLPANAVPEHAEWRMHSKDLSRYRDHDNRPESLPPGCAHLPADTLKTAAARMNLAGVPARAESTDAAIWAGASDGPMGWRGSGWEAA